MISGNVGISTTAPTEKLVVVSNDERSVLTENAMRAYNLINSVIGKKTPNFISYEKFKKTLRGEPDELI